MRKPNESSPNDKKKTIKIDTYKVSGVKMFDNGGVIFNLELNGIMIYGCRVVEAQKGDFISLPQRKGGDGKWYSIVWALFSDSDTSDILKEVENQLN